MSAAKHTPEPWRVAAWSSHAADSILAPIDPSEPTEINGQTVVQYGHAHVADCEGSLREGGNEANAARIVACVNAMAGIPDPAQWIAEQSAAIEILSAELQNIVNAKRGDFIDAEEFQQWAQNRSRHTLAKFEALASQPTSPVVLT